MQIGFAICGSFCTFSKIFPILELLTRDYKVIPIVSQAVATTDTRFGTAKEHLQTIAELCGQKPLQSITDVEPLGPKKLLDALVIAPCTGNTLGKIAHGITDGPVTMATKSHLRNSRPVLVAISTNDGLSGSAGNIGALLNRKNMYFVPFGQDDPFGKPTSIVADFSHIPDALAAALKGRQLQPILL